MFPSAKKMHLHSQKHTLNVKKWQMRSASFPTLLAQRENQLFPPGLRKRIKLSFLMNMKVAVHNAPVEMHSRSCECSFWLCFYIAMVNTIGLSSQCSSKSGEAAIPDISGTRIMRGKKKSEIWSIEVKTTKSYKKIVGH